MHRRARIKVTANLSASRRPANKGNSENPPENESLKKEISQETNVIEEEKQLIEHDECKQEAINSTISNESLCIPIVNKGDDDVNKNVEKLDKLNEKSNKEEEKQQNEEANEVIDKSQNEPDSNDKEEKFKTPVHQPRVENSNSSLLGNKFRKPKIVPRLNISRTVVTSTTTTSKSQEKEEIKKPIDETTTTVTAPIVEPTSPKSSNHYIEKQPESPLRIFSPPLAPFSPVPSNRSRCDTPREILDSPSHSVHYPPTPQSPFPHHSRIRTESLCSLKSAASANLTQRKKVRTEDQKILDNKRESRERLSNKKIEKSQLRMFDMIYYNPTSNPMKPRSVVDARSPKKIDLTMELPPTPPRPEKETAAPVPQLRLNANGEMVLDETSLIVENEEQKKNRILLANTNVVYHDELSGNYGYYKRQQRTKEWPQDETIKFFRCLNTVGTDFSLMLNLFPNRSRRDLKLKFKKEEKNNPCLVDKALKHFGQYNIEELQRELEEEDEVRRKEAESKKGDVKQLVKRKILNKQEAKARAQQQVKTKIEKFLSNGDYVINEIENPVLEIKENLDSSTESKSAKPKRQTRKRKAVKKEEDEQLGFKKIIIEELYVPAAAATQDENQMSIVLPDFNIQETGSMELVLDQMEYESMFAKRTNDEEPQNSSVLIHGLIEEQYFITSNDSNKVETMFESTRIIDIVNETLNESEKNDQVTVANEEQQEVLAPQIDEIPMANEIEVHGKQEEVPEADEKQEEAAKDINKDEVTETDKIQKDSEASSCLEEQEEVPEIDQVTHIYEEYQEEFPEIDEMPAISEKHKEEVPGTSSFSIKYIKEESLDKGSETIYNIKKEETSLDEEDMQEKENDDDDEEELSESQIDHDDEAFLNSLDLERLVIVVKQINGNEIYDIHETDSETQKLSERPLKLPRHIVDLIVSVMTQDD